MKILLIILAIIGLLKLVSLFIMFLIEVYQKFNNKEFIQIKKEYGIFYKDIEFYIIPSISFTKCNKYFEIMVDFIKWEYYAAYSLDFEDDE